MLHGKTKLIAYGIIAIIVIGIILWVVDELNKEFNIYTVQSIYNLEAGFPKQIPNPLSGSNPTNLLYEVYLNGTALTNTKIIFELIGDGGAVLDDNYRTRNVITDSQGQAIISIKPIKEGSDSLKVSVSFGVFDDYVIVDQRKYDFTTSP